MIEGEREERGRKQINQVMQQQGRKSVSNRSISVSQIVQKVVLQKKTISRLAKFLTWTRTLKKRLKVILKLASASKSKKKDLQR